MVINYSMWNNIMKIDSFIPGEVISCILEFFIRENFQSTVYQVHQKHLYVLYNVQGHIFPAKLGAPRYNCLFLVKCEYFYQNIRSCRCICVLLELCVFYFRYTEILIFIFLFFSVISGAVEHGNHFTLQLVYEHILDRTAYSFTFGPFGSIQGR